MKAKVLESGSLLLSVIILLLAAVLFVPIFKRFGLGTVVGYLIAGAVVGPWGIGVTDQVEELRHFSEFGVVFLLFIIGLELKPDKLWDMRKDLIGLGSSQIILTSGAITLYALYFSIPLISALILGFGLAMSSTAMVLQTLAERGEMNLKQGKSSFSILLMQDIVVVPVLALVPLLGTTGPDVSQKTSILGTVIAVASVILGTRYLLIPLLRYVGNSQVSDVFSALAVLPVLVAAYIMEYAGLSMALGAFLVGLLLSGSEFRHQIESDVLPFKSFLLGLFFMSIGMTLDFDLLMQKGDLMVGHALGLLAIKFTVLFCLAKFTNHSNKEAFRLGLYLPQCGEFGFVLFGIATSVGIFSTGLFQHVLVIIALTMLLSPLLLKLGEIIENKFSTPTTPSVAKLHNIPQEKSEALLIGFGEIGQIVNQSLLDKGISVTAIDRRPKVVADARKNNQTVFFGDATRLDVLKSFGVFQARIVIITCEDENETEIIIKRIRSFGHDIQVIVNSPKHSHSNKLKKAGAHFVVSEVLQAASGLDAFATSYLRPQSVKEN